MVRNFLKLNMLLVLIFACMTVSVFANNQEEEEPKIMVQKSCNPEDCGPCKTCVYQVGSDPKCVQIPDCNPPGSDPCEDAKCGWCKECVPMKRHCITTPCPQYDCIEKTQCLDIHPCALILCRRGTRCQVTDGRGKCQPILVVPKNPICRLPKVAGDCRAAIRSWYFNMKSGKCERFVYGGCDGNENRFRSRIQCERKCTRPDDGLGDLLDMFDQE